MRWDFTGLSEGSIAIVTTKLPQHLLQRNTSEQMERVQIFLRSDGTT